MTTIRSRLRQSASLWIGLGAFALTILFVNPIRETGLDDDWTYVVMVRHLLETGSYQLHQWAAANLPFQTYWGGLFAQLLGYSFTSLRISTLVLVFFGLIAFYYLAREHGLNDIQAGLTMLALLASPLVLRYSFTFNTDGQFLMWLIIALFLYTRAIRTHSYPLMFSASTTAAAAILTRQFGLALAAGVFSLWALSEQRREHALFFAAGFILPAVAGVWQLSMGTFAPTKLQERELLNTSLYFADIGAMLTNTLFRPTVILQYLALFSLPFIFLALLGLAYEIKRPEFLTSERKWTMHHILLLAVLTLYILAGIIHGHVANHLPWLMPYVKWNFDFIAGMQWSRRAILTLITATGAILYASIFVLRYSRTEGWREVPQSQRLLDLVTLFLLAEQLIYHNIGDRYLLVFLPFVFIIVGRHLGSWLNRFKMAAAIVCVVMLVASSMWIRALLAETEAAWNAAELVRAAGIEPRRIFGSQEWNFYYGATDDYLSEIGDSKLVDNLNDFWHRWYPERKKHAEFLITASMGAPDSEKWEVVSEVPYSDTLFQVKHIYVVRRVNGGQ